MNRIFVGLLIHKNIVLLYINVANLLMKDG